MGFVGDIVEPNGVYVRRGQRIEVADGVPVLSIAVTSCSGGGAYVAVERADGIRSWFEPIQLGWVLTNPRNGG